MRMAPCMGQRGSRIPTYRVTPAADRGREEQAHSFRSQAAIEGILARISQALKLYRSFSLKAYCS